MVATAQAGNGGRQQNPAYRSARPHFCACPFHLLMCRWLAAGRVRETCGASPADPVGRHMLCVRGELLGHHVLLLDVVVVVEGLDGEDGFAVVRGGCINEEDVVALRGATITGEILPDEQATVTVGLEGAGRVSLVIVIDLQGASYFPALISRGPVVGSSGLDLLLPGSLLLDLLSGEDEDF